MDNHGPHGKNLTTTNATPGPPGKAETVELERSLLSSSMYSVKYWGSFAACFNEVQQMIAILEVLIQCIAADLREVL